jgi:two-component system, chemotaxis family, chemotaxis protein CheY
VTGKKVALVGHCGPDSGYLRMAISSVQRGIQVSSVEDEQGLQNALKEGVDLLLVNRQLDWGFDEQEGIAVIRRVRARHPNVKMMLVSNYPEAQQAAVAAGALPGFGKRDIRSAQVAGMIREALADPAVDFRSGAGVEKH